MLKAQKHFVETTRSKEFNKMINAEFFLEIKAHRQYNITQLLTEKFKMKDLDIAKKFLDMKIEYDDDESTKNHQEQYIQQLLLRHDMQDCNSVHTPL